MADYTALAPIFAGKKARWLVTGAAGFIGSHLLQALLENNQEVVALDNFSTGKRENLELVKRLVGAQAWAHVTVIEGDVADGKTCEKAIAGVRYVLHQAALGSVPRSIVDPMSTHTSNVTGFVQLLRAAEQAKVERFIYASSSSVYGDSAELPKFESVIGAPLSPYAASKFIDEVYADVFARVYGVTTVGLRYFNVFGPRQDPNGAYAAVIPRWLATLFKGEQAVLYGDGTTSRDFCYIANVVQANVRAALSVNVPARASVFNVAVGACTTLRELFDSIAAACVEARPGLAVKPVRLEPFRDGDIKHSLADISAARSALGYEPTHSLAEGMRDTVRFYANYCLS